MKSFWACAFFLLLCCISSGHAETGAWQEMKSDHFILYYRGSGQNFPDSVLHEAESYYEAIGRFLGFSRRDNFWLWEKRCRIYLYGSREEFHSTTKQPEWSAGFAVSSKRKIVSFQGSLEFLNSILPHELTHLVFYDFVGIKKGDIPLWIDEGLAMSQEKEKRSAMDQLIKNAAGQKQSIPLEQLNRVRSAKEMSTGQAALFYAQSQSMVRFLIGAGPSRFTGFCRALRDGALLGDALRKNFPKEFPDLNTFEEQWLQSIS